MEPVHEETSIQPTAKRLASLLEYIEHMTRLSERPVFSIRVHKNLLYFEHELQGRIGIQHDLQDENGPTWLKIDRLTRTNPPAVPDEIPPWIAVSRDPAQSPEVSSVRMETVSEADVEILIQAGIVTRGDVSPALKQATPGLEQFDVLLRLEQQPALQTAIDTYISGPWKIWVNTEQPRRETIRIYEKFFGLYQSVQSEGVEQPSEVVWGIGIALWKWKEQTIEHPLLEALVEIELDQQSGALVIRPREVPIQLGLKPFYALDNAGAETIQGQARDFFAQLDHQEEEFSPFVPHTYETVLRMAYMQLHDTAVYYPDEQGDDTDRTVPTANSTLTITDTWAIYARRRSDNFIIEDLQRLKSIIQEVAPTALPAAAKRFVTKLADKKVYQPTLVNLSGGLNNVGKREQSSSNETGKGAGHGEEDLTNTTDFYFPKAFNDSQVAIIRRLENADGIVVQGPPGTGKTHTIANIICHYLATGRRVLVTSKGEPALSVLRDHIPKDIRDLSISLLTNEREGLRQLEAAVNTLVNTVTSMKPRAVEQQIVDKENHLGQLHKRARRIEAEISEWAYKQQSHVDQSILGDLGVLTPAELAAHVTANRELHVWFPDQLDETGDYTSRFTDEDIAAVRTARKALGTDLKSRQWTLPSLDDLPDAATLTAIHDALVNASRLQQQAEEEHIPLISLSDDRSLKRAEAALKNLTTVIAFRQEIAAQAWADAVYTKWAQFGFKSQETELFDDLIESLDSMIVQRKMFLKRPVILPNFGGQETAIEVAIEKASQGKRPFLFPFGKSIVRSMFERIRIAGKKPVSQKDWQHVMHYLQHQSDFISLRTRWNTIAEEFGLPLLQHNTAAQNRTFAEVISLVQRARTLLSTLGPKIQQEIGALFPSEFQTEDLLLDHTAAAKAALVLKTNLLRHQFSAKHRQLEELHSRLAGRGGPIVERMQRFLDQEVGNPGISAAECTSRWSELIGELQRLVGLQFHLQTVMHVADLIQKSGASLWAEAISTRPVTGIDDPWTPAHWFTSWQWARQAAYLRHIDGRHRLRELAEERLQLDQDMKPTLSTIVKLRTFLALKANVSERVEGALAQYVAHLRKIGKGTGVRARRYRRDARKAMEDCYAAVPCWIMPTWRVSESLPAAIGVFDLVIVDEASQSDISALPALLRGKKLMIVGDDKQVSPITFTAEQNILQLRHNFLDDQPYASLMLPGSSLYDLASAVFPGRRIMLQEHFRCVEPIIRFSYQFYAEEIIPLRIPKTSERLDPPLIDVYVPHGSQNGQKINHYEAVAIVDEIEKLTNDPSYQGRSMGVVSLIGREQAEYIQKILLERIGETKFVEHQLACGDSPTFQGKERDIMFISMVASPGHAAAQTSVLYQQRFNVALSRARDRMYLFRSIEETDLNPNDLKAKAIAHFRAPMVRAEQDTEDAISLCESEFERKVFRHLVDLGYRVTPQVGAGPFRIDLVVEGRDDRRLAIELDGDRFHGPERWAEDMARQRVLERVGWRFWRCWASSFALDPDGCMRELIEVLQARGIEPIGHTAQQNIYTEHRIVQLSAQESEQANGDAEDQESERTDRREYDVLEVLAPETVDVELQKEVVVVSDREDTNLQQYEEGALYKTEGESLTYPLPQSDYTNSKKSIFHQKPKGSVMHPPNPSQAGLAASYEKIFSETERQVLVGRAQEVMDTKGRGSPGQGSFTNMERSRIRNLLGPFSNQLGEMTLAQEFLKTD